VAIRWKATGTHKNELFGIPPTGKKITVTWVDLFRVAGGKLVELWLRWDQLGLMQQLGILPPPE
jgi:predicted ester cyclase